MLTSGRLRTALVVISAVCVHGAIIGCDSLRLDFMRVLYVSRAHRELRNVHLHDLESRRSGRHQRCDSDANNVCNNTILASRPFATTASPRGRGRRHDLSPPPSCKGKNELLYDQIGLSVYIEGNSETVLNRSLVCDNYAVLRDPTFERYVSDYATYCLTYTFLDLNRSCDLSIESSYMRTRNNNTAPWDVGNEWNEHTCECPALTPPSPPLSPPPSPPACARQEFDCRDVPDNIPGVICDVSDTLSCFNSTEGGTWKDRENCPYCHGQYTLNAVPSSVNPGGGPGGGAWTTTWKCELACKSMD